MIEPIQAHVVARGRVQGVGFRAWTIRQARALGLTGWVRNCVDGSVEALVEGDQPAVQRMLEALRRGPALAEVSELAVTSGPFSGRFSDFSCR